MSKQFYLEQFCIVLIDNLVLLDTQIRPIQDIQLRVRVELGEMAMKGYGSLFKAPALLEPHHQII